MRRHAVVLAALALALLPGAAHAEGPPPCTKACAGAGAFNPALADSPVTVYACLVPDSCKFGGRS